MKLWKSAVLAIMLLCASLCVLRTKPAIPTTPAKQRTWVAYPVPPPLLSGTSSSSSSSSSSSPSSPAPQSSASSSTSAPPSQSSPASPSPPRPARMGGLPRRARRSADSAGSLLSEFTYLFQTFTEGELKQIVSALVARKSLRDSQAEAEVEDEARNGAWSAEDRQGRRTKRARKGQGSCSLQEKQLTVSALGLGYESDEPVVFRYCSGRCTARRRNYDIVLEHLQRGATQSGESGGGHNRKGRARRDKARYSPCCRPTRYEELSFLGNNNLYYTIPDVFARECGCV